MKKMQADGRSIRLHTIRLLRGRSHIAHNNISNFCPRQLSKSATRAANKTRLQGLRDGLGP